MYDYTVTWCDICDKRIKIGGNETFKYSLYSPIKRYFDAIICSDCAEKIASNREYRKIKIAK